MKRKPSKRAGHPCRKHSQAVNGLPYRGNKRINKTTVPFTLVVPMSRYLNCGASVSNRRVKTKAELRALMREDPSQVTFDAASMFDRDGMFPGKRYPARCQSSPLAARTLTAKESSTQVSANNARCKSFVEVKEATCRKLTFGTVAGKA